MNIKILVVVDSIDVNDSSGSKANVALIQNLAAIGLEVKVYHYTRKPIQLLNIQSVVIKEQKANVWYLLSRSQRIFTRYTKININPFVERIFGFSFTFFNDVKSIVKALNSESSFKPDLVITLSKGMSFRPHKALLKLNKFHNKWMAYVHDPYPYHHFPNPYKWIEPGYKIKESFFKEVSEKAKFSAFPSKLLLEWMGNFYPNFIKTGIVIPHQNFNFNQGEINLPLPKYIDLTKFNILHAGSLIGGRSPKGLIKAFKKFIEINPSMKKDSRLILIGNNTYYKKWIENEIKGVDEILNISNNIFFNVVNELQHQVSVNVILEANTEINPFLPGKFPHCVKANKSILALTSKNSELIRLLGNDYEYWANPDDIQKIKTILTQLFVKWEHNPESLKLDRDDLEKYLSLDSLKTIIESIKLKSN